MTCKILYGIKCGERRWRGHPVRDSAISAGDQRREPININGTIVIAIAAQTSPDVRLPNVQDIAAISSVAPDAALIPALKVSEE
jgi:hypothetical protein